MSAPARMIDSYPVDPSIDPSIAPPRRRLPASSDTTASTVVAIIPFDPVLDCGPVKFKLARRVKPSLLSPLARPLYRLFVRSLPRWWPSRPASLKVPPAPKAELGIFDLWYDIVAACKTPDHQINVLPANRSWPDDEITYTERSCRPLDTSDPQNMAVFQALSRMYNSANAPCPGEFSAPPQQVIEMLHRIEAMLEEASERMIRIEEREGHSHCATSNG